MKKTRRPSSRRPRPRSRRAAGGFNILELIIVMAIIMIIAGIGLPNLRRLMLRFRLEGAVQGVAQVLGQARGEAVRRGFPVVVEIDPVDHELFAFTDVNGSIPRSGSSTDFYHALVFDAEAEVGDVTPTPNLPMPHGTTDYEVARLPLPTGASEALSVAFWAAGDSQPGGARVSGSPEKGVSIGLTLRTVDSTYVAVFLADGSVRDVGGLRIGMGPERLTGSATSDMERNFYEVFIGPKATAKLSTRKWVPTDPTFGNASYQERYKVGYEWNWKWYG